MSVVLILVGQPVVYMLFRIKSVVVVVSFDICRRLSLFLFIIC